MHDSVAKRAGLYLMKLGLIRADTHVTMSVTSAVRNSKTTVEYQDTIPVLLLVILEYCFEQLAHEAPH